MNYPQLIQYLKERFPGNITTADAEALDFFSAEAKRLGPVEFRKELRNHGLERVPQISQDWRGEYQPRIICRHVLIDSNIEYVVSSEYSAMLHNHDWVRSSINGEINLIPRSKFSGYPDERGNMVPLDMWIRYGQICPDCGAPFIPNAYDISISSGIEDHDDDDDYEDDDDVTLDTETVCANCAALHVAYPYNTQVQDMLGFEETNEILYGVELEYEGLTARTVAKYLKNHALAKRDGSIDHGVEVVTKPACLKTHKDALKNFFTHANVRAEDNTGMHVHIERAKLTEYQVGFIMQFLNSELLVPQITRVAGRRYASNNYCKNNTEMTMTWGLQWEGKLTRSRTSKYSALNTSKPQTIEVRIFASPESYLECAARLEFIDGLVKYSSPYSVNVKRLKDKFTWPVFEAFMAANAKTYPNFAALFQGGF